MGQHMDLSLTPEESASEDIYLNVISMKSASVIECACYVGAFLANTNQALVESFALFGNNLGMAGQIANDIKSVINMRDIKKGKITLPAIYALAQTDGEIHDFLKNQFFNRPVRKLIDPNRTRDLLYNTGAIHYSTIKMELYKQKAADILIELERSGIRVGQLKQFLD
jgi:geranylgeranyl pyrophosphate synthase